MQIRQARAFLEEEQGQELPLGQASQNQNLLSTNNRLRSPRDQARPRQVVIPIDKDTGLSDNHTHTHKERITHLGSSAFVVWEVAVINDRVSKEVSEPLKSHLSLSGSSVTYFCFFHVVLKE